MKSLNIIIVALAIMAACLMIIPLNAHALTWSDSQTISVQKYNYYSYAIHCQKDSDITLTIQRNTGPNMDVYLLNADNYSLYQSGRNSLVGVTFIYMAKGSGQDTGYVNSETHLSTGNYYLVIDNTQSGKANPDTYSGDQNISATISISVSSTDDVYSPAPEVQNGGGPDYGLMFLGIIIGIGAVLAIFSIHLHFQNNRPPEP